MRRRSLLVTLVGGLLSLAGCPSDQDQSQTENPVGGSRNTNTEPLPSECPTSQNLGVAWPRELNASAVATFIEAYEPTFYRELVFEFEPESRFSRVGSTVSRVENVTESGHGWRIRYSGILGIEEAFTRLKATTADRPEDADVIAIEAVDGEQLAELLEEAADTGAAERRLGPEDTDAYIDRLENLSEDFEISSADYHDTLYFDVDGTIVELSVSVDTLHVDREWNAWYYLDPRLVWRSGNPDVAPRDGNLLECRTTN